MTGVLNVDTIADNAGTGPVTLTKQSAAKVLVSADDDATLTGNDWQGSFNVSSGTDHGTGDYSYSITSAFDSTAFFQASTANSGGAGSNATRNPARESSSVVATELFESSQANKRHNVIVHGDLA